MGKKVFLPCDICSQQVRLLFVRVSCKFVLSYNANGNERHVWLYPKCNLFNYFFQRATDLLHAGMHETLADLKTKNTNYLAWLKTGKELPEQRRWRSWRRYTAQRHLWMPECKEVVAFSDFLSEAQIAIWSCEDNTKLETTLLPMLDLLLDLLHHINWNHSLLLS